jgi:hypothetical protein
MDTAKSNDCDNLSISRTDSESCDVNAAQEGKKLHINRNASKQGRSKGTKRFKNNRNSFTVEYKKKSVENFLEFKKKYPAQPTSTYLRTLSFNGRKVSKSSFSEWRLELSERLSRSSADHRKRLRKGDYPELESFLLKYFEKRESGLTYDNIRGVVLEEAERLSKLPEKKDYNDFKASNRWILNVMKRNGLEGIRALGEGAMLMTEQ